VRRVAQIIESSISSRQFKVFDPREAVYAVFNATIRFHYPAHSCEWSTPDFDTDFAQVWRLVQADLMLGEDV
jgi:hypothetical protein